jgi:hypothetical protein
MSGHAATATLCLRKSALRGSGPTKFPPWAADDCVGRAVAAAMGRSFNRRACPRKDFRRVFFLRKFSRNSVSFNVPETRLYSGTRDAEASAEAIGRHTCAAEKPHPAARQICATRVAFGLPQDSHMQLMFEACVNRRSRLSAFRGVGFHCGRGVADAARRPRTSRKRLNRRPNLHACTRDLRATPLKRFHRHGFL